MGLKMAGKVRHLVNRSGRYFARLVIPKDLRAIMGKTEIRTPLGGDYRQALKLLPGAVARLQAEIGQAERQANANSPGPIIPRYPLTPEQIAASHYAQRIAYDEELRNNPRYASIPVDDFLAQRLRDAMAGRLSDADLSELIGARVERFRAAGNLTAQVGSDEWRQIARALCVAEYEALSRAVERDEGDFSGKPDHPMIVNTALPEEKPEPVKITTLWQDYVQSRIQAGFMRDKGKRQAPVIENLRTFLKHNDARQVTRKDLIAWRDQLIKTLSAKTVNDIYLSTVRSLFKWAHENERLPEDVASSVKQPKPRRVLAREKGYTNAEAKVVLKASRSYEPQPDEFGRIREKPQSVAAKRWVPIICAFTGARVSEITQLRAEDLREEGGRLIIRITPDAGTVKSGGYRDVPLHRQIVSLGFADFVQGVGQGPLFHTGTDPKRYAAKAKRMSNQIADWLRISELKPDGVQPNYAWRHRLKTQALEMGLNIRVIDAMQGHSGRTAGENYGDVTLIAKAAVIDALPEYDLT